MKKIISLILCIFLISSLFIMPTAADTDSDVSYSITVSASTPASGTTYQIGETVTVTVAVSTKDAMGEDDPNLVPAPIYAFNGVLNYNSFLLGVKDFVIPTVFNAMTFKDDAAAGKISFSYLCSNAGSELAGVKVDAEFLLIKVNFTALKDGISAVSLSDMLFTNKSAGTRPIVSSITKADIGIGSGETVSDAQTLAKSIADAKEDLEAAVVNRPSSELVYPAFTVSEAAYTALDSAIKAAEEALSNATLPGEFLEAENALSNALRAYDAAKIYGKVPDDSTEGGGVFPGLTGRDLIEVTAAAAEHGTILYGYEKQLVRYGTSVTVLAAPDEGYEVEKVVVNGVAYPDDTTVTIASVISKTHIEFFFRQKPKAPRFTDVARGSWYFDAVEKITEMGLFAGTSATEFSPDMPMTRAMLVTVLHRLDGKPAASVGVTFNDVAADTWYTDAIAWASENGIVNGYTADTFGTNDSISRQDMVTILYRYLKYKGLTPADGTALDAYTDAADVSDYAKPAVQWAYATGLIKGTSDTTLSPKDDCTRAQVATIILRYTENIAAE